MTPFQAQLLGMLLTSITSIVVALVSSGGFWKRMEKKNGMRDLIQEIKDAIVKLDNKIDENEAKASRKQIVQFNDELLQGQRHSLEGFNLILDDVTTYEQYCQDHPKFPNDKAKEAINNIRNQYRKCVEEGDFQ